MSILHPNKSLPDTYNMKSLASLGGYFQVGLDETNTDLIQREEFEAICSKLMLMKGEKLLDVGCELVIYAAEEHSTNVIGITANKPLHTKLNQRIAAAGLRGIVKLMDYRNLVGVKFDKAVCLDPFATVGRKRTVTLLGTVYNVLHPGGLFLVRCLTVARSISSPSVKILDRLAQRFDLLHHSSQNEFLPFDAVERIASQIGFEIQLVEDLSQTYLLGLKHWLSYLQANQDNLLRDASEAHLYDWNASVSNLLDHIESGDIQCRQWLLAKPSNSHNHVVIPDSQRCCEPRKSE